MKILKSSSIALIAVIVLFATTNINLDYSNCMKATKNSYISKEGYATVSSYSALVPSIKTQLDTLESEVALLGSLNGNESNILLLNSSLATVSANVADHDNALNTLSSKISTLTSDVSNINNYVFEYILIIFLQS